MTKDQANCPPNNVKGWKALFEGKNTVFEEEAQKRCSSSARNIIIGFKVFNVPFCFVKITKRGWIIWSKEKIKTCGVLCWLVVKLYRGLNLHLYEYPLELTLLWWEKVATLSAMCMIEYNIKKSYSSCLKFQVWNGCDWLEVKHKKVEFALVWITNETTLEPWWRKKR